MRKPKIKRFSLETIVETVRRLSDLNAARLELAFAVGVILEVSGTVRKVVKRDGSSKLVVEPGDVPGFVVFADCPGELEANDNQLYPIIRKGSRVTVRGSLLTFGAAVVCLSDCRTQGKSKGTGARNLK